MTNADDAALSGRLDQLERTVAELAVEVRFLRTRVGAPAPQVPPPTPVAPAADRRPAPAYTNAAARPIPAPDFTNPAPTSRPRATWSAEDVEGVVGRYGMLGLATLTGLAAVGTFLGWAVSQGLLGPTVRVGLGLLLAVALAGTGAWLRPRERSFGAALLGIALAVVHVCAWAVSPAHLALVPSSVALTVAVIASVALAVFAHGEDDEPLWCVGFGGAAVAPFVTSGGSGSALLLALYGAAVLLLGSWALHRREWPIAGRVLTGATALYVVALLGAGDHTGAPLLALGLALLIAAAGVLPFSAPVHRRGRLRALGVLAAIACVAALNAGSLPIPQAWVIAAVAVAGLVWLAMLDASALLEAGSLLDGLLGDGGGLWDWVDAAFIPLAIVWAMLAEAAPGAGEVTTASVAALVLAMFVARRPPGALRDAAVFALTMSALHATWRASAPLDEWRIACLAVAAMAFVLARRWRDAASWVAVAGVTLVLCSAWTYAMLGGRTAYAYTPFATRESGIAAVVAVAWFAMERSLRAPRADTSESMRHVHAGTPNLLPIVAWSWVFFWGHQELIRAFSPAASTLLIISYYAATSVITVWYGRTRSISALRHIGLVFALVAAASAARGAARLDEVWARGAGYLVTSVFLLALAWWYRGRTEKTATASTAYTGTS